jgi:phosphoglycolate phosphatase-like HAD superfamily hydrolase
MLKIKALISDADGTLVDTMYVIRHGQYEASKRYLEAQKISSEDMPDFETYARIVNKVVGKPARDTIESTLKEIYKDRSDILGTIDFDKIARSLGPIQDEITNSSVVRAYEGFHELMKTLSDNGIKFAIFTSGAPHHIVRNFGVSLPELGLSDLYKDKTMSDTDRLSIFIDTFKKYYNLIDFTVVTSVDTIKHKPDPDSLLLALKRLNVQPNECVVIGDHTLDMYAAKNAGVSRRIGVTHGFDDRKQLETSKPTHIIDSLKELTRYIV